MFLIIYLVSLLGIVVGVFALFTLLEILRHFRPYFLFQLHVKFVTKGWYRVKHAEESMTIHSCFVKTIVYKNQFTKGRMTFDVESGFISLFEFGYLTEQKKIEKFTCSEAFAKGSNQHDFQDTLHAYIECVLNKEKGKKSEKTLAIEKMNDVSFSSKKLKKEQTKHGWVLPTPTESSANIQRLLEQLNGCIAILHEHQQEMDVEMKHTLHTLIEKRIPNLLPYAKQHEEKVQIALSEVLHKMEEWCAVLEKPIKNNFEKELLLLQKTLQR